MSATRRNPFQNDDLSVRLSTCLRLGTWWELSNLLQFEDGVPRHIAESIAMDEIDESMVAWRARLH